jgi:broad specificity phosphatase PhoE
VRTVELRRNSPWDRSAAYLSQGGLALVEAARAHLGGSYSAYYTSPSKRCRVTMKALGFATFREVKEFGRLPKWFLRFPAGLNSKDAPGTVFLEAYLAHDEARQRLLAHGAAVLEKVKKVARKLADGGRALVISHLLTIELAAMIARGDENPAAIGAHIEPLEGVAMDFDGERVAGIRALRLPRELYLGTNS